MFLVFDIGGTNMRIATSSDGKILSNVKTISTPKDFNQGIQTLKLVANELSGGESIQAAAGGLAGVLDKDKTMLLKGPNIGGWVNKPFKHELEKALGAPVYLENDAGIAGLGEAAFGAGVGKNIVAFLTVGTGVGGARIVDGRIDKNRLGFEPGHQIIAIDGKPCNCGGKGHLEAYIGGVYINKASPGIWDETARYLAMGLNNVTVFWSPDIIILGGSIMKSVSIKKVKTYLKQFSTIFPQIPEIKPAALGNEAGLYGVLAYLNQQTP